MITERQIQAMNECLREAMGNNGAFLQVTLVNSDYYNIMLHPGIKGPLNMEYFTRL